MTRGGGRNNNGAHPGGDDGMD